MKKSWLLFLPTLLSLVGCNQVKNVALVGEDVTESMTATSDVFDLLFSGFSFNNSSYKIEILPISPEHPSGYTFTHSENLMKDADFSIESQDGHYGFKTKQNCQLSGGTFQLTIYAALNYLTIESGIACSLSGVADIFRLEVTGAADIAMPSSVTMKYFDCVVPGAANLNLAGSSTGTSFTISGAASIKAKDLIADYAIVDLSGAGQAEVYAAKEFNGSVSGAGSIVYYGNPASVKKKVDGLGSIKSA